MAIIINSKVVNETQPVIKKVITKSEYEIPKRYRDSFYLANASLFDSTNWFLHRAYEVIFTGLKKKLSNVVPNLTPDKVTEKVENVIQNLDQCNSVIDVRYPIKRDGGLHQIIRGFRAQHGLTAGYSSCLGGLRIHQNITRDQMKGFSVLSTYRNACVGINMMGAYGGIKISPVDYSPGELQRIVKQYAAELIRKGYCGERDVMQPDINTTQDEMSWIASFAGVSAAAGKSPEYGGLEKYEKMASHGAFCALNFFLNEDSVVAPIGLSKGLQDKTFIIQGLGKLGKPLAKLLVNSGALCVGVKDEDAYIYNSKGIDLKKLLEHKQNTGSIKDFDVCKHDTNDIIYGEQCDMLIFAACQKSLICYTANKVKAKVILEAADSPMSPTSHKILIGKSKLVIPDIYACSGATIASYLEYLLNMQQLHGYNPELLRFSHDIYGNILNNMTEKRQKVGMAGSSVDSVSSLISPEIIPDSVKCVLTDTGKEIVKVSESHQLGTDIRTAAYMIGIENIFSRICYEKRLI